MLKKKPKCNSKWKLFNLKNYSNLKVNFNIKKLNFRKIAPTSMSKYGGSRFGSKF